MGVLMINNGILKKILLTDPDWECACIGELRHRVFPQIKGLFCIMTIFDTFSLKKLAGAWHNPGVIAKHLLDWDQYGGTGLFNEENQKSMTV